MIYWYIFILALASGDKAIKIDFTKEIMKMNLHSKDISNYLEYAVKCNRNILKTEDILLAAMEDYESILRESDSNWVDKRLNKSDITFSHVCGYYDDSSEIKFEDIKEAIFYNDQYNVIIRAV